MVWLSSLPHVSMALPTESMFSFSDDALHVERSISAVMVCRVKSILISFENEEPFGEYDDHVISTIRSIGMEPIQWDVDSLDWKGISAGEITKRVTSKVQSGSIVLFHNAGEHTPEALPDILDYLLAEGYKIVPISKILLTCDYTIDHEGRQCPAEAAQ